MLECRAIRHAVLTLTMPPFLSHPLTAEAALALIELRHAPELTALVQRNHAHLYRWLSWVSEVYREKDARAFIRHGLRRFVTQNGLVTGIWVGEWLAGVADLHTVNWQARSASLGYWLGEEWQGRGLVTLACRALIHYAFDDLGLTRVEVHAATDNHRSRAIPERLGFRFEGVLPEAEWLHDHCVDHAVYALTAEEWRAHQETAGRRFLSSHPEPVEG